MADVIGTLVSALQAAYKVYTVIQLIKDAPNDIQALCDDAFQVHGFLEKLLGSQGEGEQSGPLHVADIKDPQIAALAKKAQIISGTVEKFLSKTTTKQDNGTYVVKKLKWPLYAGDARTLSEQFKAFYVSLTAAYTVSTS